MRGKLQAALDGHLATFQTENVAWENTRFDPVRGTPWLQTTIMPATSRVVAIGPPNLERHTGIYQILVKIPGTEQDPPGAGPANVLADALAAHFRPGTVLAAAGINVEITYAETHTALPGVEWFVVPISIGYRSHSYQS